MNDSLRVHPDVRILEARDPLPAPAAMRKQRECVSGELLQDRIVVAA